ncbi:expressed protein [Echinococcus multilocularis]|uniref:Expressed protein n=1 Tax=Echinococcus multilocularis TaxID=6211 RepID=A0A068Y2G8_ECHMU|nr:expressed protein [Echinococcus multilocularis]
MNAKSSKHTSGKKVQGYNLRKSKIYSALKISHLPKHFEEEQLRKYFSQFGPVYGIYLPRSKKTLNARDKAFILVDKEIAPIIASTVHNVLNFNRIMKCVVLESYYPSWFNRTPQRLSSVDKEKLRRARSVVKPAKNTSKRRMKSLRNRVAALKKLAPGFQLNMASDSRPTPLTSS